MMSEERIILVRIIVFRFPQSVVERVLENLESICPDE